MTWRLRVLNFAWLAVRIVSLTTTIAIVGVATGELGAAQAQATAPYPKKPIRIVVPFAAGGGIDLVARIVASGLSEEFGQPVVVENRPGGSGNIAGDFVAKSAPDGYTVMVSNGGLLHTNAHLMKSMPFDPMRDLIPITELARIPNFLVVPKSLPPNTVTEFLEYVRKNSGKMNFGSQGNGTTAHISGEMLNSMLGTKVIHVPYRGTSTIYPDLVSARVDFFFDSGQALAYVRDGSLKLLAITSASRSTLFPELPTLAESGLPDFLMDSNHTVTVPAGTPREIINTLHRAVAKHLKQAPIESKVRGLGIELIVNSPDEAAKSLRTEYDRIGRIIKRIGIEPE